MKITNTITQFCTNCKRWTTTLQFNWCCIYDFSTCVSGRPVHPNYWKKKKAPFLFKTWPWLFFFFFDWYENVSSRRASTPVFHWLSFVLLFFIQCEKLDSLIIKSVMGLKNSVVQKTRKMVIILWTSDSLKSFLFQSPLPSKKCISCYWNTLIRLQGANLFTAFCTIQS